jgi:hypothetical protein
MVHSDWLLSHCLFCDRRTTVREKAKENNMATAENSRFAEGSEEFSLYKQFWA